MRRGRLAALLLCAASPRAPARVPAAAAPPAPPACDPVRTTPELAGQVPTAEEVIGIPLGERDVTVAESDAYLQAVAAASPRSPPAPPPSPGRAGRCATPSSASRATSPRPAWPASASRPPCSATPAPPPPARPTGVWRGPRGLWTTGPPPPGWATLPAGAPRVAGASAGVRRRRRRPKTSAAPEDDDGSARRRRRRPGRRGGSMGAMTAPPDPTAPSGRSAPAGVPDPGALFEEFGRGYRFGLDDFQRRGCLALASGQGTLVAAPTGAGKTVVGEFAVWLALRSGGKAFYTTPSRPSPTRSSATSWPAMARPMSACSPATTRSTARPRWWS